MLNAQGQTPLQVLEDDLTSPDGGFIEDAQRKRLLLHIAIGDYNYKTGPGTTLLHLAVSLNQQYAIEQLLAHGVDINVQDDAGNTPLMSAVQSHDPDAVTYLLGKPACKVNQANPRASPRCRWRCCRWRTQGGAI